MPRVKDSGTIDFAGIFARVQAKLLADLALSKNFEHPTAAGNASEALWLELLQRYLPRRYGAQPAFVVNANGQRSRQIDIAVYDKLGAPLLFPHHAGMHLPVESVYAVFEVKTAVSVPWLRDAGVKAASVRALQGHRRDILAGILATSSIWAPDSFEENLRSGLAGLPEEGRLTHGCALEHGAFEDVDGCVVRGPQRALIFLLLSFIRRLQAMERAPEPDMVAYMSWAEEEEDEMDRL